MHVLAVLAHLLGEFEDRCDWMQSLPIAITILDESSYLACHKTTASRPKSSIFSMAKSRFAHSRVRYIIKRPLVIPGGHERKTWPNATHVVDFSVHFCFALAFAIVFNIAADSLIKLVAAPRSIFEWIVALRQIISFLFDWREPEP
jgi:hypothetical protein